MKDFIYKDTPDFRVLFESLPGMLLILRPDFSIVAVNEGYLRTTMRDRKEIVGRSVFDVFPDNQINESADSARILQNSLEKVLETKKPDKIETLRYDVQPCVETGNSFFEKYWEILNSPILDENGDVLYIIISVEDVTKRVAAVARAAEQEQISDYLKRAAQSAREDLEQILSSITDSFFRLDSNFRYTYVNRATVEMFGLAESDFIGKTLWELFPDVQGNRFHSEVRLALKEQKTAVFENYYSPLDRWFENRIYPSKDGLSIFVSDITKRKKAELKLQETSAVLNAINLNTPTLIYVKDRESRILSANPATCDVIGKPLQQIVGKNHTQYLNDPNEAEKIRANDLKIIEKGKTETFEEEIDVINGKRVFLSTKTPYRNELGEIIGLIGVSVDISERKKAERALRESEKQNREILESIKDGFFALNDEWKFTYVNKTAEKILFSEAGDLIGKTIWESYPGLIGSEFERIYRRVARERAPDSLTDYYPDHDRWYEVNVFPAVEGITIYFRNVTEIKQAEANLREAQNRLESSLTGANLGVWTFNVSTGEFWADGRAKLLHGYEPNDDLNFEKAGLNLHPEDRELSQRAFARAIENRSKIQMENRIILPDGDVRWIASYAEYVLGEDKDYNGGTFYGVVQDITKGKQAEAALRESEEKFRALADNISQLAWMADASGSIFWYNERWYEYTGTTFDEVKGWKWRTVHHSDHADRVHKHFKQSLEEGKPWEDTFPLRSKSGEYRWFLSRALPIRGSAGDIVCWFGTNTDITELRTTRRELEEANALLDTLFDQAPIGFGYWDENLRFSRVNRALAEMNGFSVEQHLGKTVAELLPEVADGVMEAFHRVIETGNALVNLEAQGKTPANPDEHRYWNVSYYPINLENKIAGVGAVCEEITERKRAEVEREKLLAREQEARREAETANRLKDEFLATVSHELRTPLNAMLGWSTIVRQGGYQPEVMRRAFEIIERNARNQEQIIADILDVSRIITGKLNIETESVELGSVLKAAIDTVRPAVEAKQINLITDFNEEVHFIRGDSSRLQQVVWNLLSNAVKFTPEGGMIFVSLARRNGQFAEITVRDTGCGIEPEFLPFVFDRFRQADAGSNRKHGGLGLGLSIVRHLVELHGGTVFVESRGKALGATFKVQLPLFAAADLNSSNNGSENLSFVEANVLPPVLNNNRILSGVRVLAVDDEADALELLKIMLHTSGASVTIAASAAEALEKLNAAKFDILISDLGMPDEDGFELMRKIRNSENLASISAIAVSAYASEEDSRRALAAGFSAHLPKPIDYGDLNKMISNLVF